MPKLPFDSWWARRLLLDRIGKRLPDVGVVVTDLMSGQTVEINPDTPFKAASVAKVSVAMTVLNLATRGRVSLDDTVAYHAATDYAEGAGSIRYGVHEGQQFALRYLLDRLIRVSDNVAWNMLERYIGAGTIDQYIRSLGVKTPYTVTDVKMTPRDTDTLMLKLDRHQAGISPALTEWLLSLMASTVFRNRIPARLPPEAYVAEKVGMLSDVIHDVGLVYAPQRSFAMSAFTANIPEPEAVDLIADLAARIYWYEDWLVRAGGP